MTAAESAPAVSRPEGGWRDGDWVVKASGGLLNPVIYSRGTGEWPACTDVDAVIDQWVDQGLVVYVHAPREPEPVMEPLPTEPCAIRATVRGVEGVVLVGPNPSGLWFGAQAAVGALWHSGDCITAWEGLKTRAEWEAEQDGDTVRVPVALLTDLRAGRLDAMDFFADLDAERGDQA